MSCFDDSGIRNQREISDINSLHVCPTLRDCMYECLCADYDKLALTVAVHSRKYSPDHEDKTRVENVAGSHRWRLQRNWMSVRAEYRRVGRQ